MLVVKNILAASCGNGEASAVRANAVDGSLVKRGKNGVLL